MSDKKPSQSYFLKTSGSIGYIDIKETKIFDYEKVSELVDNTDIVINLIGILFESGKINTFEKYILYSQNFCLRYVRRKINI